MGYCESTDEDGHLCLCVWSRLPLVVLYYSLPPANTPSRQHQFGADQHSFCSPALSRCQPSLLSCQHFYNFMCGEPTASVPPLLVDANLPCFRGNTSTILLHVQRAYGFSMLLQSVCGSSIYTHPCIVQLLSPLDATFVSSLRAGLHSISSQHPACQLRMACPRRRRR